MKGVRGKLFFKKVSPAKTIMRITFIGTSHGVPEPERRCSCTMIETQGRYYFIDMGTQAIEDVIKRGIAKW